MAFFLFKKNSEVQSAIGNGKSMIFQISTIEMNFTLISFSLHVLFLPVFSAVNVMDANEIQNFRNGTFACKPFEMCST